MADGVLTVTEASAAGGKVNTLTIGATPAGYRYALNSDGRSMAGTLVTLQAISTGGDGGGSPLPGMIGTAGPDNLSGSAANDLIAGAAGNDTLAGLAGDDLIYGNQGTDTLYGGQGDDRALGGQGDDCLFGNAGNDVLSGNLGNDIIYGNQGNDVVNGNQGADVLFGGQGNDVLYGGQDDDTLVGGMGDDILVGGLGADRYVFGANSGRDLVLGFNQAEGDRIALSGQTYTLSTARNGDALLNLLGSGVVDLAGIRDPPPMKWSALWYGFEPGGRIDVEEATQA